MTEEEKNLLVRLLCKANEEGCISICDRDDHFYAVSHIFCDGNEIEIVIEK